MKLQKKKFNESKLKMFIMLQSNNNTKSKCIQSFSEPELILKKKENKNKTQKIAVTKSHKCAWWAMPSYDLNTQREEGVGKCNKPFGANESKCSGRKNNTSKNSKTQK